MALLQMLFIVMIGLCLGFAFRWIECYLMECCTGRWIAPNYTDLSLTFNSTLHGQHLVGENVIRSIRGHLEDPNPRKALVLSLHGWTGTGKNFVGSMIVNNMYYMGFNSKYVRLFVPSEHFLHKDKEHIPIYKDWIKNEVVSRVKMCPHSLFIFDEIEEMPEGVIDAIKPYIDFHEYVDGVSYRKAIFILLSNDAGNEIIKATMKHEERGIKREMMELADIQKYIIQASFNENGGLKHSNLIHKNLISAFLPFLPLERKHVILCIMDEIHARGYRYSEDTVSSIIKELPWYPEIARKFSATGCKWVADKVKQHYG